MTDDEVKVLREAMRKLRECLEKIDTGDDDGWREYQQDCLEDLRAMESNLCIMTDEDSCEACGMPVESCICEDEN